MKGIANIVSKRNREKHLSHLKYKYPRGVVFRVTGDFDTGWTIQAKCLKINKWTNIEFRKHERPGSVGAGVQYIGILQDIQHWIDEFKKYNVKAKLLK